MVLATNLGFPRIGPTRELKRALEAYWRGRTDAAGLLEAAQDIRRQNWRVQRLAGLDHVPSNDFSLYDHVLDTAVMLGAIPERFGWAGEHVSLETYFSMARGTRRLISQPGGEPAATDVAALEMTKWFDTNYHYLVPELRPDQELRLASTKPIEEFLDARAVGLQTRPVLLGPVTFLLLGKTGPAGQSRLALLDRLLPVYEEVLRRLAAAGADWVQVDEPCLVLDLAPAAQQALHQAYTRLSQAAPSLRLLVATYFGALQENLPLALALPIAALHLDLVRAPAQLDQALEQAPPGLSLSLGLVDGRNVWRADLEQALALGERAVRRLGSKRVMVAPSCSLLHVPVDLALEARLDDELRPWLAFAAQKLDEVALLAKALSEGRGAVAEQLAASQAALAQRARSGRSHDSRVQQRAAAVSAAMVRRQSAYAERRRQQQAQLRLPTLPTTTIGSFPQTAAVRRARAEWRAGRLSPADYEAFLRSEVEQAVRFQEEAGLDVLVHGEFERTDMVEYFGAHLGGFALTEHGWVQSYGSRCVKPPVIYGDVSRQEPLTVEWTRFAQSLTDRPVKGMLTGPVTILQWSFVRDDQPRSATCRQIALALRDEVEDLESAGIQVIQIDEPALREGLPLRRADWQNYLAWAVEAFRLASSGVRDSTQIHTHMCYAEFNDIIEAVAAMDADVISIEASRSHMELLSAFAQFHYPNEIGPGVYDVHSPLVPGQDALAALLRKALTVLSPQQLWVNPDCGLKTRRWEEVRPALQLMVAAAREVRSTLTPSAR